MLEKTLGGPLGCKEIQPIHPKRNQFWIFTGRTDAKAEAPILWPPDAKNWLIGKDCDTGKDWRQEKGMTEDEMVGWHHQLDWHEFEQAPSEGDGQGSLACCSPWHLRESDMTEWVMNWTDLKRFYLNSHAALPTQLILPLEIPGVWISQQLNFGPVKLISDFWTTSLWK